MSTSPRLRFGIVAAGLSCLFAGYVVAQQEQLEQEIQPDQPGAAVDQLDAPDPAAGKTDRSKTTRREYTANFRGNPANAGAQQDMQRYIVACLLAKNQAEVEMGKFAQQQAQSPEVKEFAQMLVQDHGKLIQKIQQVARADAAGGQPGAQPSERTRPAAGREAVGQNAAESDATNRAAGNDSAVDQLIALDRQMVEHCTEAAKKDLQEKQGAEFDKCYVSSQIFGHAQMLSALEVLQQQGPEAVQQLAQEAHPGVQKHLEHAKQLMKQLEGAGATGSRAARQPTQPQR